jgi:DNA (cytosine-5)-methyltransferase 1
MSYGFHTARTRLLDFRVIGAVDTDEHANKTYEQMLGITPDELDVKQLAKPSVLKQMCSKWGYDPRISTILIGCAPCQGFSSHRKRYTGPDTRNLLLAPFASIVRQLMPEVIVMENVPEMLHEENWRYYATWRRTLLQLGYSVRARLYNMAAFGVPQERFRALVVASRRRAAFTMPAPKVFPNKFVTVRQAIGKLRPLRSGETDPQDAMHVTSRHHRDTVRLLELIPPDGGSQRDLPANTGPSCLRVDGFRDVYGRMFWDRPANAITTRCRTPSAGRYAHPEQHRGLSVREAALLQSFPPQYYFDGPFDDKFKQIGNAVAPLFSQAIAEHLDSKWFAVSSYSVDTRGDIVTPLRKSISSSLAAVKRKMRESNCVEVGHLLGGQ